MTNLIFVNASGKQEGWNGSPTQYGGLKIDRAWVAAQDADWAVPFAAKLIGNVAVVNLPDGNLLLDKNLEKYRKQVFFPFAPISAWKIDTCHGDSLYPMKWAKYHPGLDINIVTGGNTDFNKPYLAVADGIVVFVSDHGGGAWGGLVVVWHPQLGFFSRYGHHKPGSAKVKAGDFVKGGETVLAHVGRGENNAYTAHLHMDFITKLPPRSRSGRIWWAYWNGNDLAAFKSMYLDPAKVYAQYNSRIPLCPNRCRPEAR